MSVEGPPPDVFADLGAEEQRLEQVLLGLDEHRWSTESGAVGWSITDVVLHLAQSEELVLVALGAAESTLPSGPAGATMDQAMDDLVRRQRAAPEEVLARWRRGRRSALAALRDADPGRAVPWAAAPLRPATLATTRLAEHWTHGLDITGPLGVDFDDTDRLQHVAWLAHRSLPYAFSLAGVDPQPVRCELDGPDGAPWRYGPPDAPTRVEGSAGDFCRVAARRLDPAGAHLQAEGPYGEQVLTLVRTYAA